MCVAVSVTQAHTVSLHTINQQLSRSSCSFRNQTYCSITFRMYYPAQQNFYGSFGLFNSDHLIGFQSAFGLDRIRLDRIGSGRPVSDQVGLDRIRSDWIGSGRIELDQVGPYRIKSDWISSERIGSGRTVSDLVGSDRIRSDRIGSDRVGSDLVGPYRIRSDRIWSDRIWSDRIGSDWNTRKASAPGHKSSRSSLNYFNRFEFTPSLS